MIWKVLRAAALISSAVAAAGMSCQSIADPAPGAMPDSEIVIESETGPHHFDVELAATPEEKSRGLMFRRQMAATSGMLFEFSPPRLVSMWMKNTFIALDMLFIDSDGRIVNIAENTTPHSLESIPSAGPVLAVLELNAGTARRLGFKPGDRVVHPLFSDRR